MIPAAIWMDRVLRRAISGATKIIGSWCHNLFEELKSAAGWKLLGKAVGFVLVLWGIVVSFTTYHSDHLNRLTEVSERSYYQITADLGSSSARIRTAALRRVVPVMLLTIPEEGREDLRPLEAIKLALGARPPAKYPYHDDLRTVVLSYMKDLHREKIIPTEEEEDAFVDLLASIGDEGWYSTKKRPSVLRKNGLQWLWLPQPNALSSAAPIFEGVSLNGINLQDFALDHADFNDTDLAGANLRGASLSSALLDGAVLDGAKLSAAHMEYSSFVGTHIKAADLEGSDFNYAHLRTASEKRVTDGSGSYGPRAQFKECDCLGAIFRDAVFTQVQMQASDFENANLTGSDLSGGQLQGATFSFVVADNALFAEADLTGVRFDHASLRSASFLNAVLYHTDFRLSDLRDADLSGLSEQEIGSCFWKAANIAGAKGLTTTEYKELIRAGAVDYPTDKTWLAFRTAQTRPLITARLRK
jgi:uncharacterized protein YjbI with pentapeptide repeats